MKYHAFVERFSKLPLLEPACLLEGSKNLRQMYVQLSRWQKTGRLIQLCRGFYVLPESYRKTEPSEVFVASRLHGPSYVSLEKALEYHGVIPEAVSVYTSVTSKRPLRYETPLGIFDYRHIQAPLFWGYESVTLNRQTGFMARPEKAFLDLFYLRPIEISPASLKELRIENFEKFDARWLKKAAARFGKEKMVRAADCLIEYLRPEKGRKARP